MSKECKTARNVVLTTIVVSVDIDPWLPVSLISIGIVKYPVVCI